MLPRPSFRLIAVLSALVAARDAFAFPFGSTLTARAPGKEHAELAKRHTVNSLNECYAVCDKIFPNHRKRVEFTFTDYAGCRSGCAANIKAPQGSGRNAAVEHPDGRPSSQQKGPTSSLAPQPTQTPTAEQPEQPSIGGDAPAGGDTQAWLDAHNSARAKYHAPPLTWSDEAAAFAADWASKCIWDHSEGTFGENLAGGDGTTPKGAVDMWVDEAKKFDFNNGGFSLATGHFTQVVWQATTKVGCATVQCGQNKGTAKGAFLVCEYADARGNAKGAFRENVKPA